MTLLEVLFGIGILLVAFMGFYGVFQVSVDTVSASKSRAGAIALAGERMEYIRSLPYSAVGTALGIPSGSIPQEEETSLNNTTYTRRTLVQYVDAPEDGVGASDENGITTDYKVAKVELIWTVREIERRYALVSNIVPKGIETLVGGGTLSIQVFDASAEPVSSASVHIVNTTGTSTVDVTVYTNSSGFVTFPGAPSGGGYQVTVTKDGYSIAKTYAAGEQNPNPTPGHLSIAEGQTTSASFAVDLLASLTVRTWKPIEAKEWEDVFADSTEIAEASSTSVSGGALALASGGEGYDAAGHAYATTTAPAYPALWKSLSWNDAEPSGTEARYRLYADVAGVRTLIPDSDLPGNSTGFSVSPVALTALSTSTYRNLIPAVFLSTTDASSTPEVLDWKLMYDEGPTPLPGIPFALRGTKTIGTDAGGGSIYKVDADLSTGGDGSFASSTIEWDSYAISIDPGATGLDVAESCAPQPSSVPPGAAVVADFLLVPQTTHSLLVAVRHATSSALLGGASIRLYRGAYDTTLGASSCGQAFFEELSQGTAAGGNPYSLSVSLSGYAPAVLTDVDVSGPSTLSVSLTPQ